MDTTAPTPAFPSALARVVATVSTGFVVTQLDVTIVNIALAHLAGDLHLPVAGLQWVVDAYTLAFAVLMLSGGALGDRFGARRLYISGLVLFALASLACGAASAPAMLIAARAMQGVGAAAMLPNSLALLNDACRHDPHLRARAVGWWTAAGSISIAAGPVVGGVLIAAWGWRGIFLVNLPLCAAGLAAAFAWIPARGTAAPAAASRSIRALDLRGQFIAIAMLAALTGAVIEWRPLGFTHPVVAGGFVLAALAALAFVAVEARTATPMLPLSLFRHRTFSAAVLFGICVNLTYYGTVFVLALYLQRARGESALQAGLAFLPLTGGFLLSNLASGRVVARHGPRVPMLAGALVAALGYGSLHFIDASTPLAVLLVPFLLIPTGMGFAVPAMTTAVLASVAPERAGIASAVLNTARQAGGAMGVAAFGALAGGGGAAQVVSGLRIETAVSVALLVTAALLATRVRPDAHRGASSTRQAVAAAD
ncbi:MAG: MFS transporter [Burkholderia contaminans]|uniref:MFS transporter n=1 Tax=Burkholderia contaminans TaxID=488447 RepID=A0AAP4R144_9BURK|nr:MULTISPECIES: MFS transporter [Burkholderia]MBD1414187.1 MFS transporter [Burkholderia contaminans]MBH9666890.1 MFS transporter [Burkholderia contaminans]MBH9673563.1 MFS transporter [Burkholderia contaminans]MBH9703606.1 MFS transporter [Burkholderia contaminans]MBH9719936.1 MFS transporter [Burkholderia contaminans]